MMSKYGDGVFTSRESERAADSLQGADALCLWRILACYFLWVNITLVCALEAIGLSCIFSVCFQPLEQQYFKTA